VSNLTERIGRRAIDHQLDVHAVVRKLENKLRRSESVPGLTYR